MAGFILLALLATTSALQLQEERADLDLTDALNNSFEEKRDPGYLFNGRSDYFVRQVERVCGQGLSNMGQALENAGDRDLMLESFITNTELKSETVKSLRRNAFKWGRTKKLTGVALQLGFGVLANVAGKEFDRRQKNKALNRAPLPLKPPQTFPIAGLSPPPLGGTQGILNSPFPWLGLPRGSQGPGSLNPGLPLPPLRPGFGSPNSNPVPLPGLNPGSPGLGPGPNLPMVSPLLYSGVFGSIFGGTIIPGLSFDPSKLPDSPESKSSSASDDQGGDEGKDEGKSSDFPVLSPEDKRDFLSEIETDFRVPDLKGMIQEPNGLQTLTYNPHIVALVATILENEDGSGKVYKNLPGANGLDGITPGLCLQGDNPVLPDVERQVCDWEEYCCGQMFGHDNYAAQIVTLLTCEAYLRMNDDLDSDLRASIETCVCNMAKLDPIQNRATLTQDCPDEGKEGKGEEDEGKR